MKLELIPIGPDDEKRAWAMLPHHLIQSTLHNELVRKIFALRDTLETTAPQEIAHVQRDLAAHRFLLGLLHRHDNLPTN